MRSDTNDPSIRPASRETITSPAAIFLAFSASSSMDISIEREAPRRVYSARASLSCGASKLVTLDSRFLRATSDSCQAYAEPCEIHVLHGCQARLPQA